MLELLEPVGFMHQAQVDELEAVARVAGAQGQDGLGLVVRVADRARAAMIERLPIHLLRMAEPQAHAVDADVTEGSGNARASNRPQAGRGDSKRRRQPPTSANPAGVFGQHDNPPTSLSAVKIKYPHIGR